MINLCINNNYTLPKWKKTSITYLILSHFTSKWYYINTVVQMDKIVMFNNFFFFENNSKTIDLDKLILILSFNLKIHIDFEQNFNFWGNFEVYMYIYIPSISR